MLVLAVLSAPADADTVAFGRIAVEGLPVAARVVAYAVADIGDRDLLVVEVVDDDGLTALYLLDHQAGALHARVAGPSMIPGGLQSIEAMHRVRREIRGGPPETRYWSVGGEDIGGLFGTGRLVSAPILEEFGNALLEGEWPETPPADTRMAIHVVSMNPSGSVASVCLIEPNISRSSERMTTAGAWEIDALGESMLLVPMLVRTEQPDALLFLRLYSSEMGLLAQSSTLVHVDTNRIPALVQADLTGDGSSEYILFGTSPGSVPVAVVDVRRSSNTRRVLALQECGTRMNGSDVRALQAALERRGFSVGPYGVDGWYGPDTRAAVIRFQRASGLPVTGVVADADWTVLGFGE